LSHSGPVYHALSVYLSQAKLIMRDMLKLNFLSPEFGTKFQTEVPLFLEIPEFPFNTVYHMWKEAAIPKISPYRSAVSIEHRFVTDGHTLGHS